MRVVYWKAGRQTTMERITMSMSTPVLDSATLADICEANDIEFLGVFGSHARGTATPESDVDLLVRFSKPKSLLDIVRVERLLGERLGRTVDLVTEGALSPYLRERVKAETRKIYERKG